MADSEVIKEWLVSLGIKVDDQAVKKGLGALNELSLAVTKIGSVIAATAVAAEAGMMRLAEHMEAMYFTAQRAGTTIQALEGLRFAAQNLGISGDTISKAAVAFHDLLQTAPGMQQVFRNLTGWTGPIDDSGKAMSALAGALYRMAQTGPAGAAAAKSIGDQFGLTWDFIQKIGSPEGQKKMAEGIDDYARRVKAAGVDEAQLGQDSLTMMDKIRQTWNELGIIADQVGQLFMPMFQPVLDGFERLLEVIADLKDKTGGWSTVVLGVMGALLGGLGSLRLVEVAFKALGISIPIVTNILPLFWAALTGPAAPFILLALAIGAAAFEIWQHWSWLKQQFDKLWPELKGAITGFLNDPDGPRKLGKWIVDQIEAAWSALWGFLTAPRDDWQRWLIDFNNKVGRWMGEGAIAIVKFAWNNLLSWMLDLGAKLVATMLDVAGRIGNDLGNALIKQLKIEWNALLDWAEGFGGDFVDHLWLGILNAWAGLAHKVQQLWDQINPFGSAQAATPGGGGGGGAAGGGGKGLFERGWEWLTGGGGGGVAPKSTGATPPAKIKEALDYFKQFWGAQGAAGIVANLIAESKLDPNAVGDQGQAHGLMQWHPDREGALKAWAKSKGLDWNSFETQLQAVQYELTQGTDAGMRIAAEKLKSDPANAGYNFSLYGERPLHAMGEAQARQNLANTLGTTPLTAAGPQSPHGGPITMNQKTDIHVSGTGDAAGTARQVAAAQGRVNGDLVRNLSGALDTHFANVS